MNEYSRKQSIAILSKVFKRYIYVIEGIGLTNLKIVAGPRSILMVRIVDANNSRTPNQKAITHKSKVSFQHSPKSHPRSIVTPNNSFSA